MSELEALLDGIVSEPQEETRWLVLADWLEENDDPRRGELHRLHRKLIATCCEPERHPERSTWQVRAVELLAQGVVPCVPQWTLDLGNGPGIAFSFIPPGNFLMGSPTNERGRRDEERLHKVTLSGGFYLGVQPVTEQQWVAVVGKSPAGADWGFGRDLPATSVTWHECVEFCVKLSEIKNRRPGYELGPRELDEDDLLATQVKILGNGNGYRLPTEAEWEYACRAGTRTPFWFGDTITLSQANRQWGEAEETEYHDLCRADPRTFPSNAWGLRDMHGNVEEWCQDWYGDYPEDGVVDPQGSDQRNGRVLRGGSFMSSEEGCRAANRSAEHPAWASNTYGFRLVFRDWSEVP